MSALAFTLSRHSPNHTGELPDHEYRRIFAQACGRYGTTHDYAQATFDELLRHGIHDRALARLLALAQKEALVRCRAPAHRRRHPFTRKAHGAPPH